MELEENISLRVILKSKIPGNNFEPDGQPLADADVLRESFADSQNIKDCSEYFKTIELCKDEEGKSVNFNIGGFDNFGFTLDIPFCNVHDYILLEGVFSGIFVLNAAKDKLLWKLNIPDPGQIWISPSHLKSPFDTLIHKIYIITESINWLEEPTTTLNPEIELNEDGRVFLPKLLKSEISLEDYFMLYPAQNSIHFWQIPFFLGAKPNNTAGDFLTVFPKPSQYKNLYRFQEMFSYLNDANQDTELKSNWQIRICDTDVRNNHPFFKKILCPEFEITKVGEFKEDIENGIESYKKYILNQIVEIKRLLDKFLPKTNSDGEKDFNKPDLLFLQELLDKINEQVSKFTKFLTVFDPQPNRIINPVVHRAADFLVPKNPTVSSDFEKIDSIVQNIVKVYEIWSAKLKNISIDQFASFSSHGTECFACSLIFFPFSELTDNIVSVVAKFPEYENNFNNLKYSFGGFNSLVSNENFTKSYDLDFFDIQPYIYSLSICASESLSINNKVTIISNWKNVIQLRSLHEGILMTQKNSLFCLCSGNENNLLYHNLINEENTIQVGGVYFDHKQNPVFSQGSVGHKNEVIAIGKENFEIFSVDICGISCGNGLSYYCFIPSYDIKEDLIDWDEKNGDELIKKSMWLYSGKMGTSIATPQIASICALIFEVWPQCEIKFVKLILHASGKEIKSGTSANGVDISKMEVKFKDESIVPDNLKKIPPRLAQIDKALELTEFCKNEMAKSGNTRSIKEIVSAWLNPTK